MPVLFSDVFRSQLSIKTDDEAVNNGHEVKADGQLIRS